MKLAVIEIVSIAAILALIFLGVPAAIKYFIRYGIDYYFRKKEGKN